MVGALANRVKAAGVRGPAIAHTFAKDDGHAAMMSVSLLCSGTVRGYHGSHLIDGVASAVDQSMNVALKENEMQAAQSMLSVMNNALEGSDRAASTKHLARPVHELETVESSSGESLLMRVMDNLYQVASPDDDTLPKQSYLTRESQMLTRWPPGLSLTKLNKASILRKKNLDEDGTVYRPVAVFHNESLIRFVEPRPNDRVELCPVGPEPAPSNLSEVTVLWLGGFEHTQAQARIKSRRKMSADTATGGHAAEDEASEEDQLAQKADGDDFTRAVLAHDAMPRGVIPAWSGEQLVATLNMYADRQAGANLWTELVKHAFELAPNLVNVGNSMLSAPGALLIADREVREMSEGKGAQSIQYKGDASWAGANLADTASVFWRVDPRPLLESMVKEKNEKVGNAYAYLMRVDAGVCVFSAMLHRFKAERAGKLAASEFVVPIASNPVDVTKAYHRCVIIATVEGEYLNATSAKHMRKAHNGVVVGLGLDPRISPDSNCVVGCWDLLSALTPPRYWGETIWDPGHADSQRSITVGGIEINKPSGVPCYESQLHLNLRIYEVLMANLPSLGLGPFGNEPAWRYSDDPFRSCDKRSLYPKSLGNT
jgi:hypothetical protein